jgi:DNA-binding GntR family transcriptional regulator
VAASAPPECAGAARWRRLRHCCIIGETDREDGLRPRLPPRGLQLQQIDMATSATRKPTVSAPEREAETTNTDIYERIYVAILEHRLKPGTKLVEERLAEIFAVSRPRIREVIARLAHEQIVELFPNRGAYIARPTIQKALDVLEARRVIEPAVVRRLIKQITPDKLQRLRQHTQLETAARERNDKRAIIRLSGEFHVLLAELAGNSELARSVRELSTLSCLVIFLYNLPTQTNCRHDDHEDILRAVADGDAKRAEQLMLVHLNHIEENLHLEPEQEDVDLADVFRE